MTLHTVIAALVSRHLELSKCDNDPIIKEGYLFLSNVLEHACLLKEVDFDKMVDIF